MGFIYPLRDERFILCFSEETQLPHANTIVKSFATGNIFEMPRKLHLFVNTNNNTIKYAHTFVPFYMP